MGTLGHFKAAVTTVAAAGPVCTLYTSTGGTTAGPGPDIWMASTPVFTTIAVPQLATEDSRTLLHGHTHM